MSDLIPANRPDTGPDTEPEPEETPSAEVIPPAQLPTEAYESPAVEGSPAEPVAPPQAVEPVPAVEPAPPVAPATGVVRTPLVPAPDATIPRVAAPPPPAPPRDFAMAPAPQPQGDGGRAWLWVAIAALALFLLPIAWRLITTQTPTATYTPPATSAPQLAWTPEPTATPWAIERVQARDTAISASARPQGPVVIDYAHFNQVDARGMQPLAAALSRRGLATRVWLTNVDPFALSSSGSFPDQSSALKEQLRDASALVVISPYFFWSPQEIAVVERFVADGGRVLLISDPDIMGDAAVYNNLLSEPFGIVFNDDYLYDTIENDENYTHFFQGEFLDQAEGLSGSQIAMYGGRSISGDVIPQVLSAATTLSSRRTGVTGFTTVAIGDNRGWESGGRVLALSDFDVLTEPNVVRHDNQALVEFVAEFLATGSRTESIADFPAWLNRDVTLMIGTESGLNADTLLVGAQLQRRLEETGRTLQLVGAPVLAKPEIKDDDDPDLDVELDAPLSEREAAIAPPDIVTSTVTVTSALPVEEGVYSGEGGTIPPLPESPALVAEDAVRDVILLADYDYTNQNSTILQSVGISLVIELVTPTATPTPSAATPAADATSATTATATISVTGILTDVLTPVGTPEPPQDRAAPIEPPVAPTETPDAPGSRPAPGSEPSATSTSVVTATVATTATVTATPAPSPTPIEVLWLVSEDGLRLLADQTALIIRESEAITPTNGNISPLTRNNLYVLGASARAINSGVTRLLENDFEECITGDIVTYCPVVPDSSSGSTGNTSGASSGSSTSSSATAVATVEDTPLPGRPGQKTILLVDDNVNAVEGEESEADHYLRALSAYGNTPDLWHTAEGGLPGMDVIDDYGWVIWSNAGYAAGELPIAQLDPLFAHLNDGGRLTISSRKPFFAMGYGSPSLISDVAVVDDVIDLSRSLPSPVNLVNNPQPVVALAQPDGEEEFDVTLRRGPTSEDADLPVMVSATDEGEDVETGARLVIIGMSVGWLPTDFANTLIANMATWMLAEID